MPKVNFNTPVLQNNGEVLMRAKADKSKIKKAHNGGLICDPFMDEEGNVIQEPVPLPEVLGNVLNKIYHGEEEMPQELRLARGRLSRKISDITAASQKNYSMDEIEMLNDCLFKAHAEPSLVMQVEDILEAAEYTKEELGTTVN